MAFCISMGPTRLGRPIMDILQACWQPLLGTPSRSLELFLQAWSRKAIYIPHHPIWRLELVSYRHGNSLGTTRYHRRQYLSWTNPRYDAASIMFSRCPSCKMAMACFYGLDQGCPLPQKANLLLFSTTGYPMQRHVPSHGCPMPTCHVFSKDAPSPNLTAETEAGWAKSKDQS